MDPFDKRSTSRLAVLLALSGLSTRVGAADPETLPVPTDEQIRQIAAMLPAKPVGVGPPITDRVAWTGVAEHPFFRKQAADAEAFAKEPTPAIDELFYDVYKSGRRDTYEMPFRKRSTRLVAFTVAECLRNDGTYLPLVEAELNAILGEISWVHGPTYVDVQKSYGGYGGAIDLASTARAWTVATVDYWLGGRLKPETRARIRSEVRRRTFDTYETAVRTGRPLWFWMTSKTNWNAVCTSGVVGAALTLIDSPEERALVVCGALNSVPYYQAAFDEDGYCEEGTAYWAYGFGSYLLLSETLYRQTGGRINLFAGEPMRKAALFMRRFDVVPGVYPAFGDSGPKPKKPPAALMSIIDQRWGLGLGAEADARGSDLYVGHPLGDRLAAAGMIGFPLPRSGPGLVAGSAAKEPLDADPRRTFFKKADVLICRSLPPGRPAFGLAVKAGRNGLAHGHADNGSFVVALGGVPLVVDPGAEVYSADSFGPKRFDSMMMNSYGHGVPYVGRTLQKSDADALAPIVGTRFTDDRDTLTIDLTASYNVPGLRRLTRTIVFDRVAPSVRVTDEADFDRPTDFGTAVITLSDHESTGPGDFLLHEGATALRVTVTAEADGTAVENKIEPVTAFQLPAGIRPMRLGVDLSRPAKHVRVQTLIVPAPRSMKGSD